MVGGETIQAAGEKQEIGTTHEPQIQAPRNAALPHWTLLTKHKFRNIINKNFVGNFKTLSLGPSEHESQHKYYSDHTSKLTLPLDRFQDLGGEHLFYILNLL